MASFNLIACVAMLLVLLPMTTMAYNLSPILSPALDDLCSEVDCGKGTCKASLEYKFNFICECDNGWKRTRFDDEDGLQYLPCVIPNCTLDYSCMAAPPPAPAIPHNESIFDPCYYSYCGEGTCTKASIYKYECKCNPGSSNLLNVTVYPCYPECALGSDCERLGIKVSNSSSTPNSDTANQAISFLPGKFHWLAILTTAMAMLLQR